MDKKSIIWLKIAVGVWLLLTLGSILLLITNRQSSVVTSNNTNTVNSNGTINNASIMTMSDPGVYTTYSPSALTNIMNHKNVLYFTAPWCSFCQITNTDIQANLNKIDSRLHILAVDYDSNVELRTKYGVTSQHTFVVLDVAGNIIKKTNGLASVTAINSFALTQ